MSDRIAAIAPVAGLMGVGSCSPTRPMSVLQFHGTSDSIVPYEGNGSLFYPSVATTIEGWVSRSACSTTPEETYRNGDSHCDTFGGCAGGAEVRLCTVDDGGHTWPGGTPVSYLGKTTTDISATDVMWEFFQAHPMP